MKDFVCIDIDPGVIDIDRDVDDDAAVAANAYEHACRELPEFDWRRGHSDMQGRYLSGRNPDGVKIEIWFGDKLLDMSVSFRSAWLSDSRREEKQKLLLDAILKNFVPRLGATVKIDA